jgi:excisionase family DNA binding protein
MQNVHFSPAQIGRMIGVNESTVKRWIDADLLPAHTTNGGHRRVSEDDLQTFMREKRSEANKHSYHLARIARTHTPDAWRTYFTLLRTDKHLEARQYVTGYMLTHGSARKTIADLIAPSLREVGTAWHAGTLTISEEHRMSFRIRGDIYALDALLPAPRATAPRIILACVPGENHEIALGLIGLASHELGYEPIILGINVPYTEIIRTAESTPHVYAIGLTKIYASAPDSRQYVRSLVHAPTLKNVRLLLGGQGWSKAEKKAFETMSETLLCDTSEKLLSCLEHAKCTFRKSPRRTLE